MKKQVSNFLLFVAISVTACKKDQAVDDLPNPITQSSTSVEDLQQEFSKALAKSLNNPEVRELIKSEALIQFDNDYDVLFQVVKDKKLTSGETFGEVITSNAGSKTLVTDIEERFPLLTILVPKLKSFSANNWDTKMDVPLVADLKSNHDEKNNPQLDAYDALGNKVSLTSERDPGRPVIVVKENERIISIKKNARVAGSSDNFVFSTSSTSYYFKGDDFNGKKRVKYDNAFMYPSDKVEPRLKDAYALNAASQRDYVYYGILNPQDQGPLDPNYQECIMSFAVNSGGSMGHVADDQGNDWTDGSLEFQMDILFFNGTSGLNKISKVFSIDPNALYYDDDGDGVKTTWWYTFTSPIPIATWDMKAHGDTWKFVVNEIDPGTVTTITHTSNTKFGANWSYSAGLDKIIKLGIGFGASAETTSTNTTQIQTTTGSDFCGEAVNSFVHPVLVGKQTFWGKTFYYGNVLNTGTVSFTIGPKHI